MMLGGLFSGQSPVVQVADQSPFDRAVQQYPILNRFDIRGTPGKAGGNVLEFWRPGEPGDEKTPRPSEIPIDTPGVEYSPKARPIDILGDVVSHHLVETDPTIKKIYSAFQSSITPQQDQMLLGQYDWAKKNQGEQRDFESWKESSGLPALFRGHPFQQWPAEFNQKAYTPKQIQLLDRMMEYLSK